MTPAVVLLVSACCVAGRANTSPWPGHTTWEDVWLPVQRGWFRSAFLLQTGLAPTEEEVHEYMQKFFPGPFEYGEPASDGVRREESIDDYILIRVGRSDERAFRMRSHVEEHHAKREAFEQSNSSGWAMGRFCLVLALLMVLGMYLVSRLSSSLNKNRFRRVRR